MRHQIRGNHFMIIEDVLSFKWFTRHFEMRLNWESRHRWFITVYLAKTLSSSALVCSIQGSSESINSTPLNLLSYQFTCCPLSLHLETCLALPNSASLFSVKPCLNHLSLALAVVTIREREREKGKFHYHYIFYSNINQLSEVIIPRISQEISIETVNNTYKCVSLCHSLFTCD